MSTQRRGLRLGAPLAIGGIRVAEALARYGNLQNFTAPEPEKPAETIDASPEMIAESPRATVAVTEAKRLPPAGTQAQAQALAEKLQAHGRPHAVMLYEGEFFILCANRAQRKAAWALIGDAFEGVPVYYENEKDVREELTRMEETRKKAQASLATFNVEDYRKRGARTERPEEPAFHEIGAMGIEREDEIRNAMIEGMVTGCRPPNEPPSGDPNLIDRVEKYLAGVEGMERVVDGVELVKGTSRVLLTDNGQRNGVYAFVETGNAARDANNNKK